MNRLKLLFPFFVAFASLLPSQRVFSQDEDSVRAEVVTFISTAREACEKAIATSRAEVIRELEKKQEFARSRGDLALLEKAIAEADAFVAEGALPTLVRTARHESLELKEQRTLMRAFEEGISRYTKAGMIDDAKLLRVERSRLEIVIDSPGLRPLLGTQLIKNASNEQPLVLGRIPNWEAVSGNWTKRTDNPSPADGDAYFFAGAGLGAELFQVIPVKALEKYIDASKINYSFSAKLRSFVERSPDTAEIFVEFLDKMNRDVIDTFSSGPKSETQRWQVVTATGTVPPGTRSIRIKLASVRRGGTNNDGYFDDLSLQLQLEAPSDQ